MKPIFISGALAAGALIVQPLISMARTKVLAAGLLMLTLTGCMTGTQHHALSQEQQVRLRSIQTRKFQVSDKKQMMQAVMSTLQDLGFVVEKADFILGSITAERLSGSVLRITVTVRPMGKTMVVRASARMNLRPVTDPLPYQQFFRSLNRSAFLEAQQRSPQLDL